jgi:hypothetical protein
MPLSPNPSLPHLIRLRDHRLSLGYERIDRHAAVGELFIAPAGVERLQQLVLSTETL